MAAGGGWRISAALTLVLCCCTLRIQGEIDFEFAFNPDDLGYLSLTLVFCS